VATSQISLEADSDFFRRIETARARTDALFQVLTPNGFYDRPVSERHRLIFYLGHLEAFDWNLLGGALGLQSTDPEFDKLFSFGIDPVGGGLPTDTPSDWPSIARVEQYNRTVRESLDKALRNPPAGGSANRELMDGTLLQVAVEHRLMHAETLAYLLHNLPSGKKNHELAPVADPTLAPRPRQATIPAGVATLGRKRGSGFGWDNEFDEQKLFVQSFSIDVYPVSNHEYLKFVQAGGYQNAKYWRPEDWDWKNQQRLEYPHFWTPRSSSAPFDPDTEWAYRSMFGTIPLPPSWPVYVSHAEATAFARWAGRKLPTEAQWHRAAYSTPEGGEREYPWGDASPDPRRGNFHHRKWDATPV
jgi:iron(II)-dependent oxidoreductase